MFVVCCIVFTCQEKKSITNIASGSEPICLVSFFPSFSTICQSQEHHEKFFCTEYEKSKAIADKIARQAALDGLPIILLYPGVIYGSGKLTAGNVLAHMV